MRVVAVFIHQLRTATSFQDLHSSTGLPVREVLVNQTSTCVGVEPEEQIADKNVTVAVVHLLC